MDKNLRQQGNKNNNANGFERDNEDKNETENENRKKWRSVIKHGKLERKRKGK